jgi:hypothetical protein
MNDCAATLPQRRSSHKKAQKTQKIALVFLVPLCRLIDIKPGLEDIYRVGTNHHLEFTRLDYVTHLTIPEAEMLRSEHKFHAPFLTRL